MQLVDSSARLATLLAEHAIQGARVFGLDGADGSGKSTTANELHALLGWPIVHVDNLLIPDRGSYVAHLDTQAIGRGVQETSGPVLVEGVCLLAVAEAAAFKVDLHVYVKRISRTGRWADAEECEFQGDPEHHIEQLEAEYGPVVRLLTATGGNTNESDGVLSEFRKEVIRYHGHYQPAHVAAIVYCRAEPAA